MVPRGSIQSGNKWPPFTSRRSSYIIGGKPPNEYILKFLLIELGSPLAGVEDHCDNRINGSSEKDLLLFGS